MNALAGLMNPAQLGQGVQQAFQEGRAMAKQQQRQNALSAYAMNPNDPQAFNGLAQHAPEFAINIGEKRQASQLEAQKRDVLMRASQGDPAAKLQLWGLEPEMAFKMDGRQLEEAAKGIDYIADSAYQIIQLPPQQRAAAWDQYVQRGVQMGFDGLAQYQGQYNEQSLNAIVAKAGEMQSFQKFQQPNYIPRGEGGLQGFQFGQPLKGNAADNAVSGDLEAQAQAAIAAGADPEKVRARMQELGGQASPAPATFPG